MKVNKFKWGAAGTAWMAVLVLLVAFGVGTSPAEAVCGGGGCWKVRILAGVSDTDDQTTQLVPVGNGNYESSKLKVGQGPSFGVNLERKLTNRVGLGFGVVQNQLDALCVFDSATHWLMEHDDLNVLHLSLGPVFHLTPNAKADFYIRPHATVARVDDVGIEDVPTSPVLLRSGISKSVLQQHGRSGLTEFDDETVFGLDVGVDIPIAPAWALSLAASMTDLDITTPTGIHEGTLDLSPLSLLAA